MNMFSSLFDKEAMVNDTITDTLSTLAEELKCNHTELFVMIKPKSEKFEPAFFLYQVQKGSAPKYIRELTIKEILGDE